MTETYQLDGKMEDGGERIAYEGGAMREPATGKGRYDLISPYALGKVVDFVERAKPRHERKPSAWRVLGDILQFMRWDSISMPTRSDFLLAAAASALELLGEGDESMAPGLSPFALERLAKWYELGAIKYGDRNWEKGIPYSRCIDSALRHLVRYCQGGRTEDHPAAVVWNLFAIIHFEATTPGKFDDLPQRKNVLGDFYKSALERAFAE